MYKIRSLPHSLICMIFMVIFLCSTAMVYAEDVTRIDSLLRISPVILKIRMEPGSKQIYTITVDNLTSAPMPLRATIEGFDPSDEQSGYVPKPPTNISPLSQWISINKTDSIIPAKKSEEYSIKVSVPKTVPIGGYYAMIYFSPVYPNTSVSSKIGVIALANIGVADTESNKIIIQDFSFSSPLYEKNPITSSITITNDALHYFSAKPTLSITPLWGKSDSIPLDEKILLPGKSRSWKNVLTVQNSKWGIYLATLTVSIEHGKTVSKTIPVAILPIRLIVMSICILWLVIFLWKKRRNIYMASQILFSKNSTSEFIPDNKPLPSADMTKKTQSRDQTQNSKHTQQSIDKRIDPNFIIATVASHNGSIAKAAAELHMHRSTINRWVKRAHQNTAEKLTRKSTKPKTTRTASVPEDVQRNIVSLRTQQKLTAQEIISKLHLTVSSRTIHRILKSHNMTRTYSTKHT